MEELSVAPSGGVERVRTRLLPRLADDHEFRRMGRNAAVVSGGLVLILLFAHGLGLDRAVIAPARQQAEMLVPVVAAPPAQPARAADAVAVPGPRALPNDEGVARALAQINGEVHAIQATLGTLDHKIDSTRTELLRRADQTDGKLGVIATRVGAVEQRLERDETRIARMETQFSPLFQQMREMQADENRHAHRKHG